MSQFHPQFPLGKSAWIWNLNESFGGSIQAIIRKCLDNGISNVFIKTADGGQVYPGGVCQLTKNITDQFHASNIKVYGWGFNYGADPVKEADVALYSLEQLGIDGYIFDAEEAFENLPDPEGAATTLLQTVRKTHPNDFLAYSPFPIIDLHERFPYKVFGKYCDASFPQVYFNDLRKTPLASINWMYAVWSRWEQDCQNNGFGDSVKPIAPVASFYDITSENYTYTLNPADITQFYETAKGYKAISFWEFSKVIRNDCWNAIRDAQLNTVSKATTAPATPSTDLPSTNSTNQQPAAPSGSTESSATTTTGQSGTTSPAPSENIVINPSPTPPSSSVNTPLPSVKTTIGEIPKPSSGQKVTVTIKHDESVPGGVKVEVHPQKVAIDYIQEFFTWLLSRIKNKKGGEKKT